MATYTKALLSGSTNGKAILITAVATPGTLIHTAVAGSTNFDEVWAYAVNPSSAEVKLTLEWGEATAPDGNIEVTVPAESGLYLVSPGLLLQNSLVVRGFVATSSGVAIHGFTNRITA